MAKIQIKKKKQSIGQKLGGKIDWLAQLPARVKIWRKRMKSSVYRQVFWPALWGETGEYEVRGSLFAGIAFIVIGIVGLIFLADTRFKGLVLLVFVAVFVTFIVIGGRQFADLQGPIWWADRFALRAREAYLARGTFQRYSRYSNFFGNQAQAAPPLRFEEAAYLCELYHQLCTGTISAESLDQLGIYTAAEVNYFYRVFDIRTTDPVFPPAYIGRYVNRR